VIEIHLILIFMIAAAVIAVWVKDLLSSVVAIGAVGVGLAMAFLLLKAPDLAILQLVVEILSLIILVHATIRQDLPFSTSGRWLFNTVSMLFFLAVFLMITNNALKSLPQFASAAPRPIVTLPVSAQAGKGAINLVTLVSTKLRALDTLGEVAALFTAVVGVLAIARKIGRAGGDDGL
jgi:multisubunit Na+/H+ antiporter MnhB subunit